MRAELIKLYEENPQGSKVNRVVEVLRSGGLIICPTDTIYALCCDIHNPKALDRLRLFKGKKNKGWNYSFLCYDLSTIAEYAKVSTPNFKLMKRSLPGAVTFILPASSKVPKILNAKKKTIGIRVPDNNITRELVSVLGNPIISTSLHEDQVDGHSTDPDVLYEEFGQLVDVVIDGGFGDVYPSTVVDCSDEEPVIIREGKGEVEL